MGNARNRKETQELEAEETVAPDQPEDEEAKRYSADSLRRHAMQLFQVNPEIVDGALHGADGGEFTVKEVQARIKAYLKKEVK